jgi:hypothetical protein
LSKKVPAGRRWAAQAQESRIHTADADG